LPGKKKSKKGRCCVEKRRGTGAGKLPPAEESSFGGKSKSRFQGGASAGGLIDEVLDCEKREGNGITFHEVHPHRTGSLCRTPQNKRMTIEEREGADITWREGNALDGVRITMNGTTVETWRVKGEKRESSKKGTRHRV